MLNKPTLAMAALCLLGFRPSPCPALGPDGGGGVSLAYLDSFPRDIQAGSGSLGPSTAQFSDKDLGASGFGGSLLLGFSDALTAVVRGSQISGKSNSSVTTAFPFNGSVTTEYDLASSSYGVSLRFHSGVMSGEAFKLDHNANPDGWLFWPQLQLDYSKTSSSVGLRTSQTSGYWAGYNSTGSNNVDSASLGGSLTLPLQSWASLGMGYNRELSNSGTNVFNGSTTHSSNNGIYEAYSVVLNLYLVAPFDQASLDQRAYFPGIGRVGVPYLSCSYNWSHDLGKGAVAARGVDILAAIAFSPVVGLGLTYAASQEGSGPEDSYDNYSQSSRQPVSQSLQASLVFSFGPHAWMGAN